MCSIATGEGLNQTHGQLVTISGVVYDTNSAYISYSSIAAYDQNLNYIGGQYPGTILPIASSRVFSLRGNQLFNRSDPNSGPLLQPFSFNFADLNSYVLIPPFLCQ